MLQTAGYTVCSKRTHFNMPWSISLFSLSLRGCLVKTRTRFPIVSTAPDCVYPSVFCSSRGRIAWHPTASPLFLAGTHNYLAGIHNCFLTSRTMTTVHHGLPLGGWYCTISILFFVCAATIDGILASPGLRSCRAWPLPRSVC